MKIPNKLRIDYNLDIWEKPWLTRNDLVILVIKIYLIGLVSGIAIGALIWHRYV